MEKKLHELAYFLDYYNKYNNLAINKDEWIFC